ncbi:protein adenylyltransferase SelO-like isoform X1 [Amblyraja radiata]|uniref:protein adenylyltransferase SelO-like isoform X1 n=1 Tax=Amblyraja radiata TaxID=386614 RepID=UPI0014021BF8|nr:protein adenylyltransferase SelO-like isoform X1 [Amblyraja radiata]
MLVLNNGYVSLIFTRKKKPHRCVWNYFTRLPHLVQTRTVHGVCWIFAKMRLVAVQRTLTGTILKLDIMRIMLLWLIWESTFGIFSRGEITNYKAAAEPECNSIDSNFYSINGDDTLGYSKVNYKRSSMDGWNLTSQKLIDSFPLDSIKQNYVRQVRDCIFSAIQPTPFKSAVTLAAVSKEVVEDLLDLDVSLTKTKEFIQFVSGAKVLPGSISLAHRYGGHQFGVWSGQLGDGRAHLLGAYVNRHGTRWELQLKGSGKTPYSRDGDGRAVLRSSLREFLCSEALNYLEIPTSRAASLVISNDVVKRDNFYNGNVKNEKGAIVLRVAKSWFRFGSLEILAYSGEIELLRKLVDFVIEQHFPLINATGSNKYLEFFSQVVTDTSYLIARWMSVGFAHGVCNTDNFSIISITIDYGPFGFMDYYDSNFVPNTSDDEGRYKIGNQANVGRYNLDKLKKALNPLLEPQQQLLAEQILKGYPGLYQAKFLELFKAKLGLSGLDDSDDYLIAFLLKLMEDTRADFTMTFRQLSEIYKQDLEVKNISKEYWALQDLAKHKKFSHWINLYLLRLKSNTIESDDARRIRMQSVNPRYIFRNWMAESAIKKAERNDFSEIHLLQKILRHPFTKQAEAEEAGYSSRPPPWAKDLRVSCSS